MSAAGTVTVRLPASLLGGPTRWVPSRSELTLLHHRDLPAVGVDVAAAEAEQLALAKADEGGQQHDARWAAPPHCGRLEPGVDGLRVEPSGERPIRSGSARRSTPMRT